MATSERLLPTGQDSSTRFPTQGLSTKSLIEERQALEALPDLTQRIEKLGLTEEYLAFKERYLAWRKGETSGAKGEITVDNITRPDIFASNRGFAYWYPSVQEWVWKRTMSYWISVTFFEGSIYFTISSFLLNYQDDLGQYYDPMTLYGYCAGKVMFFVCTYFMCLETINVHVRKEDAETPDVSEDHKEMFYFWPYRYRTALDNLEKAGIGPLPYFTSATYLTGVLCFTVGLSLEVLPPFLPASVEVFTLHWSFVVGSFLFAGGGFLECLQNQTFTTLNLNKGWFGALLNFFGGILFTIGAFAGFTDARLGNSLFGWGSAVYLASSSVQISMWKDEQFGLTFMAVLNNLGNPSKLAALAVKKDDPDEEDGHATFSLLGAVFIHIYCICGAVSMYNFNIKLKRHFDNSAVETLQDTINEFLPCLFAHMMLALTSAVLRTPKVAPFRQLYQFARLVGFCLMVNSLSTLYEFLQDRTS